MICVHCGRDIPNGTKFCPFCGQPVAADQPAGQPAFNTQPGASVRPPQQPPVMGAQPEERQDGKEPVLVKISVASGITGYSVNYLYHLASKGMIPCVKRGRTLRFDMEELKKWMHQQYVPSSNRLPDEKEKR